MTGWELALVWAFAAAGAITLCWLTWVLFGEHVHKRRGDRQEHRQRHNDGRDTTNSDLNARGRCADAKDRKDLTHGTSNEQYEHSRNRPDSFSSPEPLGAKISGEHEYRDQGGVGRAGELLIHRGNLSRYPATAVLTALLLLTLTGCADPQHGAWKVKSGIWMLWVLLLVGFVGAALVVGALVYGSRRRLPRSANFEVFKAQR